MMVEVDVEVMIRNTNQNQKLSPGEIHVVAATLTKNTNKKVDYRVIRDN